VIKELVENGASLLKPRRDGITVLHIGAVNNDLHVLDYVIKTK
jgi:ankyrin repeat protein